MIFDPNPYVSSLSLIRGLPAMPAHFSRSLQLETGACFSLYEPFPRANIPGILAFPSFSSPSTPFLHFD